MDYGISMPSYPHDSNFTYEIRNKTIVNRSIGPLPIPPAHVNVKIPCADSYSKVTILEKSEVYTEKLMNMIMDMVDDIIVIHDSEHTIIWMNRAGEKAFGISVDKVIGVKCHTLFNNTTPCADCVTKTVNVGSPVSTKRRIIPKTGIECDCNAVPYYENGRLELVVQHLRPVCKCE